MATQQTQQNSKPIAHAIGRRKRSVARVWVRKGSGNVRVNGESYTQYFNNLAAQAAVQKPFDIIPGELKYDIQANVDGGGMTGQADAIKLAISRAFAEVTNAKNVLREHGLLTVDARNKERKKYGQHKARRKFQFVKR